MEATRITTCSTTNSSNAYFAACNVENFWQFMQPRLAVLSQLVDSSAPVVHLTEDHQLYAEDTMIKSWAPRTALRPINENYARRTP